MEDDRHILAVLSCQDRAQRQEGGKMEEEEQEEVRRHPTTLQTVWSSRSWSFLMTLLPQTRSVCSTWWACTAPPSLDSLPCNLPAHKFHAWSSRSFPRCLLGALCLVFFSSLPLGIYLLMVGQLWLGVVLISLVPCTLLLLILYCFCQCLCHELMEEVTARRRPQP
ncbi:E3 ubiquitin-protein ligase RNF182 [Oryzias melastigma]|uniref:E3 ubiquitin-protein ligase RNF182 n=1 Tax=Oryzias melastigma TaxID=30732 RepID=A0A834FEL3_ORYME|nr:E3 ubiquitin-protein ligase RNF182 [Oryzias melastigma]